jgi:hypothetical protein
MKKFIRFGLCTFLFFVLSCMTLTSCKAKKAVFSEAKATDEIADKTIIENYYKNKKDFKTLYIKSDVGYKDDKQAQNVSAEIKIKKDEMILVSIRFIGITMAKALITPKEVKYYEKINGKYFEGDFSTLSKWLGTDLDFSKIQNLLIGQALDNLEKGKYKASIEENLYKLIENLNNNTQKTFYFEANNFLVKKQIVRQGDKNRKLEINYPNYKLFSATNLPSEIIIEASEDDKKTNINIEYNSATFNEDLNFPYNVPSGYDKISID